MTGVLRIAAERARQLAAEGYSLVLDRRYTHGQLARAAACYALSSLHDETGQRELRQSWRVPPAGWPWPDSAWKPKDRIRDLERAGALIAAELDRLAPGNPNQLPGTSPEEIIAMEIFKGGPGETAAEQNAALARYIVNALRKAGYLP